ncbi:MAG: NAD(P)-dependent oxidoreductase [Candidatus Omnitrophota bacterium]|nr:NAD(P)-dependent oxidoreductase [Candidatus Omnitrophota bacterium]
MRILVTGATGFIGKNLVKRLLLKGHEINCLARRTSRVDFIEDRGIPLVAADITDEGEVDRAFLKARPEAVFHCAANVMEKNEAELYETNVEGTLNVCLACSKHGVNRLVYLSSVAVVSGNEQGPITDDLPYGSSTTYGWTKIEAERVALGFREKGLKVAVIRPCMVYGEDEPHLLGRILGLVKARRFPVIDIPGMDSMLNLVDVANVVQVLELAMEKDEATEGTFIVADREIITIRTFLEILYDEMGNGRPPAIPRWLAKVFLMLPPLRRKVDNIFKDRVYDISRAVDLLGYDPSVSTEEGLRRTVRDWKRKNTVER